MSSNISIFLKTVGIEDILFSEKSNLFNFNLQISENRITGIKASYRKSHTDNAANLSTSPASFMKLT